MTTRSRRLGDDLTADLLADLAATPTQRAPAPSAEAGHPRQPFIETTVYLLPAGWLRPGLARTDAGLALSAGPLRLSAGRR